MPPRTQASAVPSASLLHRPARENRPPSRGMCDSSNHPAPPPPPSPAGPGGKAWSGGSAAARGERSAAARMRRSPRSERSAATSSHGAGGGGSGAQVVGSAQRRALERAACAAGKFLLARWTWTRKAQHSSAFRRARAQSSPPANGSPGRGRAPPEWASTRLRAVARCETAASVSPFLSEAGSTKVASALSAAWYDSTCPSAAPGAGGPTATSVSAIASCAEAARSQCLQCLCLPSSSMRHPRRSSSRRRARCSGRVVPARRPAARKQNMATGSATCGGSVVSSGAAYSARSSAPAPRCSQYVEPSRRHSRRSHSRTWVPEALMRSGEKAKEVIAGMSSVRLRR